MRLIRLVEPACDCQTRLAAFRTEQEATEGMPLWGVGTTAQCECGRYYALAEDQREGLYWAQVAYREYA